MARFRRRMAAPINRVKHIVDSSATLAANTVLSIAVVDTVDNPVFTNANNVATASKVYGIYLNVQVVSNEDEVLGAVPNFYLMVAKNPGSNLTLPSPAAVGASDNRKYVFHQEMTMIQNFNGGNPRTVFNGVIKIPKGYQRNGIDDKIQVDVICPAIDTAVCFQCIYKEFR